MFVISSSVFLQCTTFSPVHVSSLHLCFCNSCLFILFIIIFLEKKLCSSSLTYNQDQNKQNDKRGTCSDVRTKKFTRNFLKLGANVIKIYNPFLPMCVISQSVFLQCGTFLTVPVSNKHLCFCYSCPFIFFIIIFLQKIVLKQSDIQSRNNTNKMFKEVPTKKIHPYFFKTWAQVIKKL